METFFINLLTCFLPLFLPVEGQACFAGMPQWWEMMIWLGLGISIAGIGLLHFSHDYSDRIRCFIFRNDPLSYRKALEVSSDFIWILKVDRYGLVTRTVLGGNTLETTGREPGYFRDFIVSFESIIHSSDLIDRRLLFNDLITGNISVYEGDYRIILPDGQIQWLRDKIKVDLYKKKYRIIRGVTSKITHLKEKEDEITKSHGFLSALIDAMTQPLFVKNQMGRLILVNDAFCRMMGQKKETLLGKTDEELFPPELAKEFRASDLQVLNNYTDVYEKETSETFHNRFLYVVKTKYFSPAENQNYIIGLITDLTDRKKHEEELRHLVFRAEDAYKSKSVFLANMSHEIRTPMNSILGMSELLSELDLGEEGNEYVNIINQAGVTLLTLINDILDLSKIEAGHLKVDMAEFNLAEIIDEVLAMLYFRAEDKKIALNSQIDPFFTENEMIGDPVRIRQVLINLVNNALKFTFEGSVDVICSLENRNPQQVTVKVEVKDTGMGIPDKDRDRVFQAFNQSSLTQNATFGGTGLGLTISKTLVELMDGDIGFSSVEGMGSVFWFRLKLPLAEQNIHSIGQPLVSIPRVLLVDDNPTNVQLIGSYLQRMGIAGYDIATHGKEAVDLVNGKIYDLILMDIQMPAMDGMEATRKIRKIESDRPLDNRSVILAITAYSPTSDLHRFISNGMDGMLRKPFLFDELRIAMQNLLGSRFFKL